MPTKLATIKHGILTQDFSKDYWCSIIGYFCKTLRLQIRFFVIFIVFENLPVNNFILLEIK